MDIDTGLMICNASHENIFLGDPNVSGKPSEGQLINCWMRAPLLGSGDHVTKKANGTYTAESRGALLLPVS